jgi:2,3,4,5-tetrahydropyridine-2-carboxylate N-succinyltransferase
MIELRKAIEAGWENRAELSPGNAPAGLRDAVETAITELDNGRLRVAEPHGTEWRVNEWLKKAVLLSFRIKDNRVVEGGHTRLYVKVPLIFDVFSAEQFALSC